MNFFILKCYEFKNKQTENLNQNVKAKPNLFKMAFNKLVLVNIR